MLYVFRYLYKNLDRFKPQFFFALGLSVLFGFATFFSPVLLAEFTRGNFSIARFQQLIALLIGLSILTTIMEGAIIRWGGLLNNKITNHLRLKQFRLLERLEMKDLTKHHSGYVLSIVNQMANNMGPVVNSIFWVYGNGIGPVVLFFLFTARESLPIAIWNLIVLIGFSVVSTFLSQKLVEISGELNLKQASLMESYADFMANIVTIKKLAVYSFAEKRLLDRTNATYDLMRTRQSFQAKRWMLLDTLFSLAFLTTIGFLLYRIASGALPAGVLILFIAGYSRINSLVDRISENLRTLMEEKNYIDKVEEFVAPAYSAQGAGKDRDWKMITFHNVRFQYPEHDRLISIPSFSVNKGEKIMLVGTSGEGKTTFLNLLSNFLEPKEGIRAVDGTPYADVGQIFFQKRMVMISQEVELFNLSLRDNMTLGRHIDEQVIIDALQKLDLLEWTTHLEKGLETLVGEKGVKLSAGQKQRINLLRGVLLDRDIYLLDEPTSHLDVATERKVIAFLQESLAHKTVIIVSHKDSLRTFAQSVYRVENHTMVAE